MEIENNNFDYKLKQLLNYIEGNYSMDLDSHLFSSLKYDHEKVEMAYCLFSEAQLFPEKVRNHPKSSKKSLVFREKGNKEFRKKQDLLAVQTYSMSIAFAPPNSEELALAYANRSAVTFSLNEYATCIKDIDRALVSPYPQHLRYKLYERKGKSLKLLGMDKSARDAFQLAQNCLSSSNLDGEKLESTSLFLTKQLNSCSGKDVEIKQEEKCIPCLSESKSDSILSASSLVQIQYSKELGRHLIASADIEPGDILVVEEPYASVLLPASYNNYCFQCKKRCHALIPCLSCVVAMYCSEECRSASWDKDHRVECSLLPLLVALDFTKIELIAVRTLLLATHQNRYLQNLLDTLPEIESFTDEITKGFDNEGHYNSADYKSVHHLVGNMELRTNSDVFRRAATAAYILHLLDEYTDYFTSSSFHDSNKTFSRSNKFGNQPLNSVKLFVGGLLFKYLMIVPSNAHEISEILVKRTGDEVVCESLEIGGALYPVLSLINHSCDPNVVRHNHNGDLNVLTAIQVIPSGAQIMDNYGYHHAVHDRITRQRELLSQYLFRCQCCACLEDWPIYSQLLNENPVYLNHRLISEVEKSSVIFNEILQEIHSGKMDGKLPFLMAHLALLHRAIKRPWREYSACQEAIKQCLSVQANHYLAPTNL